MLVTLCCFLQEICQLLTPLQVCAKLFEIIIQYRRFTRISPFICDRNRQLHCGKSFIILSEFLIVWRFIMIIDKIRKNLIKARKDARHKFEWMRGIKCFLSFIRRFVVTSFPTSTFPTTIFPPATFCKALIMLKEMKTSDKFLRVWAKNQLSFQIFEKILKFTCKKLNGKLIFYPFSLPSSRTFVILYISGTYQNGGGVLSSLWGLYKSLLVVVY